MTQIYSAEDHFLFIGRDVDARAHDHLMIQIAISVDGPFWIKLDATRIECRGIIVNSNISHMFESNNHETLIVLIDPSSNLGEAITQTYLDHKPYHIIDDFQLETIKKGSIMTLITPDNYGDFLAQFLSIMAINVTHSSSLHEVVLKTIGTIQQAREGMPTLAMLASDVGLSQSRLSHLFKEQTGYALYSYILMVKIRDVANRILRGDTITEAALAGGFDSPSHFATVCKKTLGMSMRDIRKDSVFLEVSTLTL